MQSLYISRVIIKNYRNFKDIDILLNHKGVIVGENNVGKTNFLKALQLILDPSLSDEDRILSETDFNDSIQNPLENDEEIVIQIYVSNFSNNRTVLAMLSDAVVNDNGEEKILLTYKYYPIEYDNGETEYSFNIFKGNPEDNKTFTHRDRKYLNIKVIKALRDVEPELKNSKISPINKLLKEYKFNLTDLEDISESFKLSSDKILDLDEIKDITRKVNLKFFEILGDESLNISLGTQEIDPNKILSAMKIMLASRNINDISLGLNNIIYISLIMQLLQDTTIPSLIKSEKYDDLISLTGGEVISETYTVNTKGNYVINDALPPGKILELYSFMETNNSSNKGVTILGIEEPEAHLHPIYQRLIYKDIIRNNDNSVIMTTHSTHITSISPIESIIHLYSKSVNETAINTSAKLDLGTDARDIERYLDVKRGELYLSKGVILIEGITEEYMIPQYARLLELPLDEKGIVVCNIDSTNFKPYVSLLKKIGIPYVVIIDGDFYYKDTNSDGEAVKVYHVLENATDVRESGYLGIEITSKIINDGVPENEQIVVNHAEAKNHGIYVGKYTFETDMMEQSSQNENAKSIIRSTFDILTDGGNIQKQNFSSELEGGEYIKCLRKIENNVGKGRFAQVLSESCVKEHISPYIKEAIEKIYEKVNGN